MVALKSILVDTDALAADHPAVAQAAALAERSGAQLKVVDVLPWVPADARQFVTPAVEEDLVEHRRERLTALAAGLPNVKAGAELLRGRPASALIAEVLRSGHDLLVRSHGRDLARALLPYGAIDMELLRYCPCPVWLAGRQSTMHRPWRILAAVHANAESETEQLLNASILNWALTFQAFGADLTILQAWSAFGEGVLRSRLSPEQFAKVLEEVHKSEQQALSDMLAPFEDRLAAASVELEHGEPSEVIARYVESRGIDLVVIGTVARTGIAGLVMGNTAESVLRKIGGSVLAIKPEGFETPVAR